MFLAHSKMPLGVNMVELEGKSIFQPLFQSLTHLARSGSNNSSFKKWQLPSFPPSSSMENATELVTHIGGPLEKL